MFFSNERTLFIGKILCQLFISMALEDEELLQTNGDVILMVLLSVVNNIEVSSIPDHWNFHQTVEAKSQGTSTQDQGGVGQSGSSHSSDHHGRTHQDQESSTKSGPPRPGPVAFTPTAQAAQA